MIEKTWHMSPHRRKIFIDMVGVVVSIFGEDKNYDVGA